MTVLSMSKQEFRAPDLGRSAPMPAIPGGRTL
jgi:hypothetical protein